MQNSKARNYLAIWRKFSSFLLRLEHKPKEWEDRVAWFCTFLIDSGRKSTTIRSYISAIKTTLWEDGYQWVEDRVALGLMTRACRIKNDVIKCRFPIHKGLLEIILFEIQRVCRSPYLIIMYRAMFLIGYYGLMRVGEIADGLHTLKAANIHIASNKDKILLILYTSKTHLRAQYLQEIKITSVNQDITAHRKPSFFCPFKAICDYLLTRGSYVDVNENFFIFLDRSAVQPCHMRMILRTCLQNMGLNGKLYDCHGLHVGWASDLRKAGIPVETIMKMGCWRSNAVYRYLRDQFSLHIISL